MEGDSPFTSKLGTNYAATDEEIVQLVELLSAPEAKLTQLQEEIDRVYAAYTELCAQRDALSRKVADHRALMSPIRRLPIDITQEVFLRCLPTEHNPIMSRSECPMLLTQVCSSWRRVAHATALLWPSIHIVIPSQVTGTYLPSPPWQPPPSQLLASLEIARRRATGITEWLGRSGECPLDIAVYNRDRSVTQELYDIILDAIMAFSQRWACISFQTPSTHLGRIAAMSESDVPLLQSLMIKGKDVHNNFLPPGTEPAFNPRFLINSGLLKAPQLCEIAYSNVTEDFSAFPLRWSKLTTLSLTGFAWTMPDNMSLTKIANIMRRCEQLITCTLEVAHITSVEYPEACGLETIRMPCLEAMSIQSSRGDLTALLQALEVPCLQNFEFFTNLNNISDSLPEKLHLFLTRIAHTLTQLCMDPLFLTKAQFLKCLHACPRVSVLSLRQSHYSGHEAWTPHPYPVGDDITYTLDDDFLRSLIAPQEAGSSVLLPELEELECNLDGRFSDTALVDFIKTKCTGGTGIATLKSIAIALNRPQTLPMVDELRQYVQDGLDCRLSYTLPAAQGPYPASDGIYTPYSSSAFRPWGLLVF